MSIRIVVRSGNINKQWTQVIWLKED